MEKLKSRDFASDNEIKWCPGCGDHAILKHLQSAMAKSGSRPENTAVISGIGCASRLPYYMSTYGFHTIHGRALPIASGLKLSRPEMDVWVVTGDGDALSIGANHYVHFFRKQININVLLFNNSIYGLTKGQYSPTSPIGQKSKSSPYGSEDKPVNALSLALNSGASMICRTFDRDAAYIQDYMIESKYYKADSIIEILQNCPIFNDKVFEKYTAKSSVKSQIIRLQHGELIKFGENEEFTIVRDGFGVKIEKLENINKAQFWIHDETDLNKAKLLVDLSYDGYSEFPLAMGIIYRNNRIKNTAKEFEDYEQSIFKELGEGVIEIK